MSELYPGGTEANKPAWQSKTLWINLILASSSFFPALQPFLTPEVLSTIFLVINTGLRFVTKTGVRIR